MYTFFKFALNIIKALTMFFTYFFFFVDFIKVQRTYQNLTIFIEQLVNFVNCVICVCLFEKVKVGKLLYWGKDR